MAEAAPSWDPKPPLLALHPLPSPSLRFQYNFQLTSMSIEQVGRLDCRPITGNHSAPPQLSPPGRGAGGQRGSRLRMCRQGRGFRLKAGSLQQLPTLTHIPEQEAQEGVEGEALEDTSPGSLHSLTQRALSGSSFFVGRLMPQAIEKRRG